MPRADGRVSPAGRGRGCRRVTLRLAVPNPDTNAATTVHNQGIVRALMPAGVVVEGHSIPLGPAVVTNETALAAAARGRFSIITTTPDLKRSILSLVDSYGHTAALASLPITPGDSEQVTADTDRMQQARVALARDCAQDGARSVLIGGGPLARAARGISEAIALAVIEPVAAGARLSLARIGLSPDVAKDRAAVL